MTRPSGKGVVNLNSKVADLTELSGLNSDELRQLRKAS